MHFGLLLTEFLNYNGMAKAVAKSASRSISLPITKCKAKCGFEYATFAKLFDSLEMSVIELYCKTDCLVKYICNNIVILLLIKTS